MSMSMKKEDWDKLCRNIYENKCILFLGPEFPIKMISGNEVSTFSKLLADKIKKEIKFFERLPAHITNQLEYRELSQLACDYINYKQLDRKMSREEMETLLIDYLAEMEMEIESDTFEKLATLPFTFIVDTNYTNFFSNILRNANKTPVNAYYNFKGNRVDIVTAGDTLGTELSPFVYNLFGSPDDAASLVISENDLIQCVINIISRNPGLPANIKSELANQEKIFLFIGFGFIAKNWYFRILLQVLETSNKGRMSYALECINDIQNDEDPTVLFFKDELKLSLYRYEPKKFVDDLKANYDAYIAKKQGTNTAKLKLDDAPKAFISYKSEDLAEVNNICKRLQQQGVEVWIDKNDIQGKWEPSISRGIENANAFILIQSRNLKMNPITVVNGEIKAAFHKAHTLYQKEEDFIFPAFIDSSDSVLDHDELKTINSYDLTRADKIDQLARDIKRSYERNKKTRAA